MMMVVVRVMMAVLLAFTPYESHFFWGGGGENFKIGKKTDEIKLGKERGKLRWSDSGRM